MNLGKMILHAALLTATCALAACGSEEPTANQVHSSMAADLPIQPPATPEPAETQPVSDTHPTTAPATQPATIPAMASARVKVLWATDQTPVEASTVTLVMDFGAPDADLRRGQTDASGESLIAYPPEWTKAQLIATHPEAILNQTTVDLPTTSTLTILLSRGSSIYGRVFIQETQSVAPLADVYFNTGGRQTKAVKTDENGAYEIRQIAATNGAVTASFENYVSHENPDEAPKVNLVRGQRFGPVDLVLKPGASMTGVVTRSEDGAPIAGATVEATYKNNVRTVETDEQGRYALKGLYSATHEVSAVAEGYTRELKKMRTEAQSPSVCDFALGEAGEVHVTALDQERKPLSGAIIMPLDMRNPLQAAMAGQPTTTNTEGKVTLKNISLASPPMLMGQKQGYDQPQPTTVKFPKGQKSVAVTLVFKKENLGGGGVFEGRITDKAGKPVAGANVKWMIKMVDERGAALSDKDGNYRLVTTADRGMMNQLQVSAAGYAPASRADVAPGTEENPTRADFELEAGHWLKGTVVDGQDQPLPNVGIQAMMMGLIPLPIPGITEVKVDEKGQFELKDLPGPMVTLYIVAGRANQMDFIQRTLPVDAEHKIVVDVEGVILGQVVDKETKAPVKRFTVQVSNALIMGIKMPGTKETFSTQDGRFSLEKLKTDSTVDLKIEAEGYPPLELKNVQPLSKGQAVESLIELDHGRQVMGVVVSELTGRPIARAEVISASFKSETNVNWQMLTEGNMFFGSPVKMKTDANGEFTLLEDETPKTLFVLADDHERLMIRPHERANYMQGETLRIALASGGGVVGHYTRKGSPQPGVDVTLAKREKTKKSFLESLLSTEGNEQVIDVVQTDAQGAYQFSGLPAGEYRLYNQTMGGATSPVFGLVKEFVLGKGETKSVEMGSDLGPYTLSGRVLTGSGAAADVSLLLTPQFDWEYKGLGASTLANGEYRVEGLRPGKYEAQMMAFRIETMGMKEIRETVEIHGDTRRDLVFEEGNRVNARLLFAPELSGRSQDFLFAMLNAVDDAAPSPQISRFSMAGVSDKQVTFRGRFKGEYKITLTGMDQEQLQLPQTVQLDNLQRDQELGELVVMSVGALRVIINDGKGSGGSGSLAMVLTDSTGGSSMSLPLDVSKGDQTIAAIPTGQYQIQLQGQGMAASADVESIEIGLGTKATVRVTVER